MIPSRTAWIYGALGILLLGLVLFFGLRPPGVVGAVVSDLAPRTPEQRENLRLASQALDGLRVGPGESVSFNRVVGPRTLERGYRPAPAFLEAEEAESVGGGICQLSSTLYAAVLAGGFPVLERVAHRYRIHSVPPGRDATVWYGKADLVWKNDLSGPVVVEAKVRGDRLFLRLLGKAHRRVHVETRRLSSSLPRTSLYETSRTVDGKTSRWLDRYRE